MSCPDPAASPPSYLWRHLLRHLLAGILDRRSLLQRDWPCLDDGIQSFHCVHEFNHAIRENCRTVITAYQRCIDSRRNHEGNALKVHQRSICPSLAASLPCVEGCIVGRIDLQFDVEEGREDSSGYVRLVRCRHGWMLVNPYDIYLAMAMVYRPAAPPIHSMHVLGRCAVPEGCSVLWVVLLWGL